MKTKITINTGLLVCLLVTAIVSSLLLPTPLPATAAERLCFPMHKGLPHHGYIPPTIDGYVAREVGISTDELETGWTNSSKVSHGYGANIAQVEFRGLKHATEPFLYLSFVVHFDETFDEDDVVVLVFRRTPPGSTHSADERRIHIYPLYEGLGAGNPLDNNPFDTINASDYTIRTNAREQFADFYRWVGATWDSMARPDNFDISVRSWQFGADKNWSVEIKVPTTINPVSGIGGGGGNWIDFDDDFGFYFNVIRVCGTCPSSDDTVAGFTASQFAWPRIDYTADPPPGLMQDPPGPPPLLHEVPIEPAWLGEAKMIDTPGADCRGVRFEQGHYSIGIRHPGDPAGSPLNYLIEKDMTNIFVAELVNEGASDAPGVRAEFRIANWGITSPAPGVWEKVDPDPGTSNPSSRTTIHAGALPTELTTQWTLNTQEKNRYCDLGVTSCPEDSLSPHQCVLVQLDSNQDVDFSQSSIWMNMDIVGLSKISRVAIINGKGWGKPAGPEGNQEFILKVNERFMFHPGFSKDLKKYWPKIDKDLTHNVKTSDVRRAPVHLMPVKANRPYAVFRHFENKEDAKYLRSSEEKLMLAELKKAPKEALWNWVWITNGFRKTTGTITIREKRYRIYEPAGAFGYIGFHQGLDTNFYSSLSGQVLAKSTNKERLKFIVPKDGSVTVNTKLTASSKRKIWSGICKTLSGGGSSALAIGLVGVGFFVYRSRRKTVTKLR